MSERTPEERAAVEALRDAVGVVAVTAAYANGVASDIANGAGEGAADALFDALCSVGARLREADVRLVEWSSARGEPDGVHVDDYNPLTNGHRWRVVRGGVTVARGWSESREHARAAADASWEGTGDG